MRGELLFEADVPGRDADRKARRLRLEPRGDRCDVDHRADRHGAVQLGHRRPWMREADGAADRGDAATSEEHGVTHRVRLGEFELVHADSRRFSQYRFNPCQDCQSGATRS